MMSSDCSKACSEIEPDMRIRRSVGCDRRQSPSPRWPGSRTKRTQITERDRPLESLVGMTTKILALTDALGNLRPLRPAARPPLRWTVGDRSADRRNGAFGGFDSSSKAFEQSDAIIANLNESRSAKDR